MQKKGLLVVISGPSGAGKGTIYNMVTNMDPTIKKSVSVTTRAPRKGETEGIHYYFKTLEEYQKMLADGAFLETASVYSNFYGTPKAPVYDMLAKGYDVMFEIDIVGAKQIKKIYPESILIFLMTPTFAELKKRLKERGTENEESLVRRLSNAKNELGEYKNFNYIVFNDSVEKAAQQVYNIIDAEKRNINRNEEQITDLLNENFII